jgi:dipeptidyl aminopeptidase/acylaminoacyl peptidase
MTDPTRFSVQLSPDGRWVGYLESSGNERRLRVLPVSGGQSRAVSMPGSVRAWQWSADGRSLLTVVSGTAGDRLFRTAPGGGGARDLTPLEGAQLRVAAVSPAQPRTVVVSARGPEAEGLYAVDLVDGKARRVGGMEGFDEWYFDRSLRLRAARRVGPEGFELHRKTPSGDWKRAASAGLVASPAAGVVSIDAAGRRLYCVAEDGGDTTALQSIDLATGETRRLLRREGTDLLAAGATVDPKSGEVRAVVSYRARLLRDCLDAETAAAFRRLARAHAGDVSFVGQSRHGKTWLVRYLDGGPAEYCLWRRAEDRLIPLFREASSPPRARLATRSAVEVRARDGLRLPCHIYLPAGTDTDGDGIPRAPLPTLLYVHGGPWVGMEWNLWAVNRHFQLLADRGYAVIRTEFRGGAGLGRRFVDAGDREWAGAMHHDLVDIARWAVRARVAAPGRVGIWGWSYGGYAAMGALAWAPREFACGLSLYGVSDLEGLFLSSIGDSDFWHRRVGDPRTDEGRRLLRQASPLSDTARLRRPLLLSHGGRDSRVPRAQSDRMAEALRDAGRPPVYLVFPEEGHDYEAPATWQAFWSVAERFLHDHLGGRFQPAGDELRRVRVELPMAGAGPTG